MRRWQLVIDDTGSVEDILAFIYCKKWRFGQVLPMPDRLTDSQSKDRATQLLIKYKSGALVTQSYVVIFDTYLRGTSYLTIFKAVNGLTSELMFAKVQSIL